MTTLERAGIDANPSNKTPAKQARADNLLNRYIRAESIHRAFRHRSPDSKPTVIVEQASARRRPNEPNGAMGKVYRFLRAGRRPVAAFAKMPNEAIDKMDKICRLCVLTTSHLLMQAKERTNPSAIWIKLAGHAHFADFSGFEVDGPTDRVSQSADV
jgi:hypothetical protein